MISTLNELEGKGTDDTGAASGTDDDDRQSMPEHVRGAMRLAGDGFDDLLIPLDINWEYWDPNGLDQG